MNSELQIQQFYGKIRFPGVYTLDDFDIYKEGLFNQYLSQYEQGIATSAHVLDIGCGSGMIVNLLAYRNPTIHFDAVDFSSSIDFAKEFSIKHNIQNVTFHKVNFFEFQAQCKYDAIMCNGVLHHMPNHLGAIDLIDQLLEKNGKLIIGLYNPFGKLAKKLFPVQYVNQTLFLDQECAPFEVAYTYSQTKKLFNQYKLITVYPNIFGNLVDFRSIFNYTNGGLTIYTFIK